MSNTEIIHIIGIGGIGMSAIAEILHHSNYKVQGSDAHSNNNTNRLKKLGIEVYIGHSAQNINQAQIVVYSSAIKSDNVELVAAKNNNKTILHRSDILAKLLKNKYVIAVSGSSGKTTTTAMIASIFDYSNRPPSVTQALDNEVQKKDLDSSVTHWNDTNVGIDATVIVGGILNSYQSNAKVGKGNIFLIEADESDGTMLKIPANIAVITSINDDHIDHYGTFDDIKEAFSQFINKADFAVLPGSVDINYDENNAMTFGFEGSNNPHSVIQVADTGIQEKDKDMDSSVSYSNDTKTSNIRAINITQHTNSIEFDVLIDNCSMNECRNDWIPVSATQMTGKERSQVSSQCVTLGSESTQIDSSSLSSHFSLSSQCVTLGPESTQTDSSSLSSHFSLSSQCVTLGSRIIKDVILSNAIGLHKVGNALAAISVAVKLGISEEDIKKGLFEFKGVARRFSLIANVKGVKLIEDYAHHPNEIQATLTAAHSITKGKIIGIIEPLRFARIRNFFDEFIRIFMMFDHLILTTVHPPEDKFIPGYGIDDIQKALISNGFDNVKIMNDSSVISRFIDDFTNSGDVVLFIGTGGNIAKLAKETAELTTQTMETSS
ncbi:UDP-N-acetylmuramate--L-alanine ligase [Wolbachia endosymbiont of Folsomia candida]|uniref:UDP-N-acetylmuramate--L-alanine ligase n=1 Tax=Wolbachia endosymbiont of Folsomia candida TaxID=169402 RepID=UPI000A5E850A|nr:Mur ligase domain-containing protein [Wolbachia endosymbiont of Folsomia candida]AWW50867.1 UDP-N-acetylmuramate--L-alanine ligase [Wolbachia endosymbiont of Folsomia candida]